MVIVFVYRIGRRVPAARSRVHNGIVIAIGRYGSGRIHRGSSRSISWFTIQRIPVKFQSRVSASFRKFHAEVSIAKCS